MCGRYYIDSDVDVEELHRIIEEVNRRTGGEGVKTSGEIFPTDTVPVIASDIDAPPAAFAMKWGYTLPKGQVIINARSESAMEKPLFQDSIRRRRCVVPSTNYFEWEKRGAEKLKYAISLEDEPMLYMAGIYRVEGGRPVFSILTRDPADAIRHIHDRMPVILPAAAVDDWLTPRYAARDVLRQARIDVAFRPAERPGLEQMSFLI